MNQRLPNVLWIGVDQMRADTPGFAGNSVCRTPNLDALANQSVVFNRAYAPASQCSPSRASMLTGLYAFAHGMGNNADMYHAMANELPHPEQLLTTDLSQLGYRLGYIGKWHVGKSLGPADYGFEGMNIPGYGDPAREPSFRHHLSEKGLSFGPIEEPIYGNGKTTLLGGTWGGPVETTPERYLTDLTCELLDTWSGGDQPFLITCQYWAPHPPYLPTPEFKGTHDRESIRPWVNATDDLEGKPASIRRFREDFYRTLPTTWEGWRELVGLSYDYTAMLDAEIGRLLTFLREKGLEDDTMVVFTSDHGDMNGSHGLFDKGFLYEEAHRVPLMFRWPAAWRPRRSEDLASNMDILPTILDAASHPVQGRHGRSLLPILRGQPDAETRRHLLLEGHGMRQLASQRALVTSGGLKYIFNPSDYDEVYQLSTDPGELTNLLVATGTGQDPRARDVDVEALRRLLLQAMFEVGDPLMEYAAKLFGDWSNRAGQPDASAPLGGTRS